jgi:glycosyltransferase involved in cell wall biosynthesis
MDRKYEYKVSVIIPVYNVQEYLAGLFVSLGNQTMSSNDFEIVLVNDCSTDDSLKICEEYIKTHHNFFLYNQKINQGLSSTRNLGMSKARGKYLMFLDSDDQFSPETIESVYNFFEKHYDEVDMVTFLCQGYKNGKKVALQYRYKYLTKSGIYDLSLTPFAMQTTVNVCVKNLFEKNILFDTTPSFHHEDQKYCIDVVSEKGKMGYCDKGEYAYRKDNGTSITATRFFAYYIFETTMRFWEEIFNRHQNDVPKYIQALFINDINWKIKSDILFPYHYDKTQFDAATDRIYKLLKQIDDNIILSHPEINSFHAQYFLNFKHKGTGIVSTCSKNGLVVTHNHSLWYYNKYIECFPVKLSIKNNKLYMILFIKSPVFNHIKSPKLFLCINENKNEITELSLYESSYSYYLAKVKTNDFWEFSIDIELEPAEYKLSSISFFVELENELINTKFMFMKDFPVQPKCSRSAVFAKNKIIQFTSNQIILRENDKKYKKLTNRAIFKYYLEKYSKKKISGLKIWLVRKLAEIKRREKKRIWLYYDCENVKLDNGYYQFVHDFYKEDGIKRYYVFNDDIDRSDIFDEKQKKSLVRFGSFKHRFLFLQSEKVITAYVEQSNYIPFYNIPHYSDYMDYELIYLQHGVLHSHQPWKYSLDRVKVDKEVISTTFEYENMTKNYGFTDRHLLKCGMPRYDHIDATQKPVNKILFAPSWRKYLCNATGQKGLEPNYTKFKESDYYIKTTEFLNSKELEKLLEKYDFYLDFKLHPIFHFYNKTYKLTNPRVKLVKTKVEEFEYSVFMTDFSSFVYDFAYLKRAIVYFVPDEELFRAGFNLYRELDMPLKDGLGPFVQDGYEAVDALEKILENGCKPEKKYADKLESLFFEVENHCDMIYNELMAE